MCHDLPADLSVKQAAETGFCVLGIGGLQLQRVPLPAVLIVHQERFHDTPLCERKVKTMRYVMYRDRVNQWRWQLIAANNRIIADSGESYVNKADCLAGINLTKGSANAPVYER